MAAEPTARLLTAEAFYALPDSPHGGKMELVCGEVVRHRPVGGEHSQIAANLVFELTTFTRPRGLGAVGVECGFRVSRGPDTVLGLDVHFVRAQRLSGGRMPKSFFDGPPDLAVEVVSPDGRDTEIQEKVAAYLAAGALRVWVVRPALESVTVHREGGSAQTFAGESMLMSEDAGFSEGGLALPVRVIFK